MATVSPDSAPPTQKAIATVTFSTGTDGASDVLDIGGLSPQAFETSTAWTAAGVRFYAGRSSGDLLPLNISTGFSVATTGSTNTFMRLSSGFINTSTATLYSFTQDDQKFLRPFRFFQFISDSTNSTAVVQAAARTWYLYLGVPDGPIK